MSEIPESSAETTPVVTGTTPVDERPVAVAEHKHHRLYQVAAWVGIVAGTVFIVAVIFFSGFILGRHAGGGGHFGHHHKWGPGHSMMDRGGPGDGPRHGGPGGPDWGGPGGSGGPGWGGQGGWGGPGQFPPGNPGNPGSGNFGPGGPGGPGQPPAPPTTR